MSWLVCLIVLSAVVLWSGKKFGPHLALAITTLLCLLFPFWIRVEPWAIEIHLNVAVAVASLGLYLIHPKSVFTARLITLDYIMIAMITIHAISDVTNTGWQAFILLQIYGEWFVAYVVGRLSLSEFNNVRELQPLGAAIGIILALLAITECFSYTNFYELVFSGSDLEVVGAANRWGLRRASGPTNHPIYFGTLIFLLSPWVIQFLVSKYQSSKNPAWFAPITVLVLSIFCTISRAPIAAIAFMFIGPLFIFVRRSRTPIVVVSCLMAAALYVGQSQLIEFMENSVGEKTRMARNQMVVDGSKVAGSSASGRIHLLKYYSTAVKRAGLFGYGSVATSTFPPRVPSGGNYDVNAMKNLKYVDNQYLLFTLRFGYLGLICWTAALVCTAWNFFYMTSRCPIDLRWFCACNASAIVGVMFILITVWMPQDFGFYLLWLMGGSAGLLSNLLKKKQKRSEPTKSNS